MLCTFRYEHITISTAAHHDDVALLEGELLLRPLLVRRVVVGVVGKQGTEVVCGRGWGGAWLKSYVRTLL